MFTQCSNSVNSVRGGSNVKSVNRLNSAHSVNCVNSSADGVGGTKVKVGQKDDEAKRAKASSGL